jgi:simple sugar transport system permease protein
MSQAKVPAWVNIALIPFLNIMLAFIVSGLIILAIGEDPIEAAGYLI